MQLVCFRKFVINANNMVWHAKNINLDEGKIGKVEMSPVNSLERLFFLLEINHLLVFSLHTSQSVLALYPPPPIQCWFWTLVCASDLSQH